MWSPRRFFRNLCAYSFAAVLVVGFLYNVVGSLVAILVLFFAPAAVSALQEGQKYAANAGDDPAGYLIWRVSRGMAEVYLGFIVIVSAALALSVPDFRMTLAEGNLILIFFVFGALTGVAFIVTRWSYVFGVKIEMEHRNNRAG